MDLPRNFSKEEIIEGLKAGRTLVVDRKDCPELRDLIELEAQGLVTSDLRTMEYQYSRVEFTWCGPK